MFILLLVLMVACSALVFRTLVLICLYTLDVR